MAIRIKRRSRTRSRRTLKVRDKPYFERPKCRGSMVHHHLGHASTESTRESRQIPVHPRRQVQRLNDLGPEDLQGTAGVMKTNAGHRADQPIRHNRRYVPGQEVVPPFLSPSTHDVVTLGVLQQPGDIRGVVLQIPIRGHDEAPAGVRKPGGKRGCLTEVARELDHAYMRIACGEIQQASESAILAAIIHENQLIRDVEGRDRRGQLFVQRQHVALLVAKRNDNGDFRDH